jgi:hypothetical protein
VTLREACGAGAPASDVKPRNVILIGWDGAQRDHVKEDLAQGKLPALKRLSSEGAIVAIDVIRTTDTKAGWTQILTGYEPEKTGVFSNGRFGPIPKGYSIFERLETFFGPDNIVTVAVIGKKGHVDTEGEEKIPVKRMERMKPQRRQQLMNQGKLIEENGEQFRLIPARPYFYTKDGMDLWINGLEQDEKVGQKAIELLDKYRKKPFFFFVHFAQIDHRCHKTGENSPECDSGYTSADEWTGKIMRKLEDLKLYDQTLVYVTADHGFDEGQFGHADAPYVFLGTNDPKVMRRGTRADITPTILNRFGVDLSKIDPPLDGHPLTKPYNEAIW